MVHSRKVLELSARSLWTSDVSCKQRENSIEAYKMSFDELQELLLLSHDDGTVDDEELLLLYKEFSPKNPDLSCGNYNRLELEDMNDSECLTQFRVKKSDSPILAEALQIPESFTCYQRSVESGMEGLCILLLRLSYPCRYSDVVCCDVLDFVYDTHSHRITRWNPTVLSLADPQIYSGATAAKGGSFTELLRFYRRCHPPHTQTRRTTEDTLQWAQKVS